MKSISIEESNSGGFDVRSGDRYCEGLTWDEMIGQVAHFTMPDSVKQREFLYHMMTAEEWAAREEKLASMRQCEKQEAAQ